MKLSRWLFTTVGFPQPAVIHLRSQRLPLNSKTFKLCIVRGLYGPLPMLRPSVSLLPGHLTTIGWPLLYVQGLWDINNMSWLKSHFTDSQTCSVNAKVKWRVSSHYINHPSLLILLCPSAPLHFTPSPATGCRREDGWPHRAHYNLKELSPFKCWSVPAWDYWKTSITPQHKWTLN